MIRTVSGRLVACLALLAFAACSKKAEDGAQRADMIISGGPIYTGGASNPVEAVAVADGRILAVGDLASVGAFSGAKTERIDLHGASLYPGFTDAHAHLLGIGMRELTLNLEGVSSIDELVDIIAAYVGETAPGETVYGRGWIETGWPEARFPTRDDLDPVSPDNPVVLYRADGHAAVVNSAALAAAGIDDAAPDPSGGRIDRDSSGRATGMLIDNAMGLVGEVVGGPAPAAREEAYKIGAEVYAAYGWTGVHNMSVEPDDVAVMERLAKDGALPIRVYNALDPEGLDWLVANAPRTDETGRVVTRAVKLYADGALGSRGAALLAPYADRPDTSGLLLMQEDEALAMMAKARDAGVQVATHAIGDRGNRLVLDWYERVLGPAAAQARWRIEHAQIIDPQDIPRFAALGVIPSMQPSHAIGDLYFAPARLGVERLAGAYAWRSLIDSGAIVPGGSDAPVERGDPLIEFYAAVARKGLDGYTGEGWHPEQAVTREEALKMFTLWPAYAAFQESELGTIEPGKRADFTAFSKDIMTVPEAEILAAKPVLTVVGGRIIYRRNE
ncbi:MAG: amidohydrolase [Pseudomonadota bacterium]|nr:amidohydrolase [Pseudomonadota bacterium]